MGKNKSIIGWSLVKPHHEEDIFDITQGRSRVLMLQINAGGPAFNCLLSHKFKGIILLMLPMICKWFNRLLLMYINTLWLELYVNS